MEGGEDDFHGRIVADCREKKNFFIDSFCYLNLIKTVKVKNFKLTILKGKINLQKYLSTANSVYAEISGDRSNG